MGRPVHRPGDAIYEEVRQQVLRGALAAGARLPSSRDLAAQRGVARMTVVRAYRRLLDEGYVRSQPGSGIFVVPIAPDRLLAVRARAVRSKPPEPARRAPAAGVRPFAPHTPAVDVFPYARWARLAGRAARALHGPELAYQHPQGLLGLREAIARHWNATRGARMSESQIVTTAGAQNAFDLIARSLCRPGDVVAMESPGYPFARSAFRNAGLTVVDVPVDEEGLVVDALAKLAPAPRLVYVTPAHQQPTGVALSVTRRLALLDFARRHGCQIVEDDYDSEFRYAGRPLPVLQSLDTHGRVLLVSSFSKTMFPALRAGFVHASGGFDTAALARRQEETLRSVSLLEQHALRLFMDEGFYARHLRSMRREYAVRRDHLQALLRGPGARSLRAAVDLHWPHTGFCAIGYARQAKLPIEKVTRAAAARGLELIAFRARHPVRTGIMLGFGCMPPAAMVPAVATLESVFREVLR